MNSALRDYPVIFLKLIKSPHFAGFGNPARATRDLLKLTNYSSRSQIVDLSYSSQSFRAGFYHVSSIFQRRWQ